MGFKKFWQQLAPKKRHSVVPMMTVKMDCALILKEDGSIRGTNLLIAGQTYGTPVVIEALKELYRDNRKATYKDMQRDLPAKIFDGLHGIGTYESLMAIADVEHNGPSWFTAVHVLAKSENPAAPSAFAKLMKFDTAAVLTSDEAGEIIGLLDQNESFDAARMLAYFAERPRMSVPSLIKIADIMLKIADDYAQGDKNKKISSALSDDIGTVFNFLAQQDNIDRAAIHHEQKDALAHLFKRAQDTDYLSKETRDGAGKAGLVLDKCANEVAQRTLDFFRESLQQHPR